MSFVTALPPTCSRAAPTFESSRSSLVTGRSPRRCVTPASPGSSCWRRRVRWTRKVPSNGSRSVPS